MPASSSDKFRLVAPNTGWQLDASGISDAVVTSFGLVSATLLPTGTGVTITVDRVDGSGAKTPAKMERIKGVISGTNVVSCVRGTGGTAQAHAGGAIVEIVIDSTLWNDLVNGILTFATQTGKLILSAIDSVRYGADAGGDDTYSVTLDPVPAAYYAGMEVNFKPTTANTGACTLDVNGLGAKTIKKNVSSDLATGDILSGQMVKVIYDGTNFQMVSLSPTYLAPRTDTTASSATPSINTDTTDIFTITALAAAITSMTSGLTGTPVNGQKLIIRIKDNGTARAITWGASFASRGATLPTTTVVSKYLFVGLIYNSTAAVWDCVAVSYEE